MAQGAEKDFSPPREGRPPLVGYSQVALLLEPDVWSQLKKKKGGASPFVRKLIRLYFEDAEIRELVDNAAD